MVAIILIVLIIVLLLWTAGAYNGLVKLRNKVEASFAQIDVTLQRRADLIPNLVNTVKGYAKHESETLEKVIKARNSYVSASTTSEKIEASNQITGALKQLFALAESYPDLKANQNFLDLQKQLSETEDKIQYSRQFYNDDVKQYNTACQMFPKNIIASLFHFKAYDYFKADEESRTAPKVEF